MSTSSLIYLYAAVDDPGRAAPAARTVEPRLDILAAAGIAYAVRVVESTAVVPREDHLLAHEAVIDRLRDAGTVVPFRFGTTVPDVERFHAELDRRAAMMARGLSFFRDRVELSVRARLNGTGCDGGPVGEQPGGRPTGRAYLHQLAGRGDPIRRLHRNLTRSAVATVAARAGGTQLNAAYLVPTCGVEDFRRQVAEAASGPPGFEELSLTGPWAPYSFVPGLEVAA